MKVYISIDTEGVSGIVAWEQVMPGTTEYEIGMNLVLGELNAAIEGVSLAGATELVVNDAHGAMHNFDPSRLASNAEYVSGRHKPLYMMQGLDNTFDAALLVGYHGSAGTSSALSHTYNPDVIYEARLNGQVTGEAGINALVAQAYGVPVVLVTGDAHTGEELRRFVPQVIAVQTKVSVSRFAASNLHPETVRQRIHAAAARALRSAAGADRSPISVPAQLELTFMTEDMAEMATWITGVNRTDSRVALLEDDDLLNLYRRFVAVLRLTQSLASR